MKWIWEECPWQTGWGADCRISLHISCKEKRQLNVKRTCPRLCPQKYSSPSHKDSPLGCKQLGGVQGIFFSGLLRKLQLPRISAGFCSCRCFIKKKPCSETELSWCAYWACFSLLCPTPLSLKCISAMPNLPAAILAFPALCWGLFSHYHAPFHELPQAVNCEVRKVVAAMRSWDKESRERAGGNGQETAWTRGMNCSREKNLESPSLGWCPNHPTPVKPLALMEFVRGPSLSGWSLWEMGAP